MNNRAQEIARDGRKVTWEQHDNGVYLSAIHDPATGLTDSACTASTMAEVFRFWKDHNIELPNGKLY